MNKRDSQRMGKIFRIGERKHVICGFSVELLSLYGVNVREYEIDVFLSPAVKRGAGFCNTPEQGMIVFNVRFLVWGVRITEKHFRFGVTVKIVFKRKNVAEFSAVISQKSWEDITETESGGTEFHFQIADFAGSFGSGFVVQQ